MYFTLILLAVVAVFFAMGKTRSDIVALCALIALLLAGILTPSEALAGFSNPVVIMMAGLFIVGGGVLQTGLAKLLSSRLLRLAGGSETGLFLLVMMGTAAIGAYVSSTREDWCIESAQPVARWLTGRGRTLGSSGRHWAFHPTLYSSL